MKFDFNIYSSFLLTFFVHILVYALMVAVRAYKQERLSDALLSSFLLLAAFYIVPWMVGFAGWYMPDTIYRDILFYTPFLHGLFMGPILYFYVKSLTNYNFRLTRRDGLHFLPGFLYLVWCLVVFVVDNVILKKYYLMNGQTDPDFETWYQWAQNISIIYYLILSIRYYKQYKNYADFEFSFLELAGLKWLRNFLIAFAVLTILPLIFEILQTIPAFNALSYVGSWYYYFGFIIIVYYIAISGYNMGVAPLRKLVFEPKMLLDYEPKLLTTAPETLDVNPEISEQPEMDVQRWVEKVTSLMMHQKPYEDPELTLSQMAKQLKTNPSVLSRVINTGFQKNFNDFVNEYRVNAVIQKLKNGEQTQQTLLSLALDCGFNSKATFNRAFKKQTNLTPRDWLESNI